MQAELKHLRESHWRGNTREGMHTNNPKMMDILDKVETVAPTISTVLLLGETGTGKSMMAKMIHGLSNRSEGPFISVHCGAIPDTLVESELFGHEKGAFTGADRRRLGKFQAAEGGTIFLDEVGTISMAAQVRLLQVLQEKQFTRVGGDNLLDADVRIIAASNEDLGSLCDLGRFRRDLFYRLNVFPLRLPPLRERPEDIPGLVDTFIKRLNQTHGKSIWGCDPRSCPGWPRMIGPAISGNWPTWWKEPSFWPKRTLFPPETSLRTFSRLKPASRVRTVPVLPAFRGAPARRGRGRVELSAGSSAKQPWQHQKQRCHSRAHHQAVAQPAEQARHQKVRLQVNLCRQGRKHPSLCSRPPCGASFIPKQNRRQRPNRPGQEPAFPTFAASQN